MNSDNNTIFKDKKCADIKKSPDAVETPVPPQHMDPSEKPAKEKNQVKENKNHKGRRVKK